MTEHLAGESTGGVGVERVEVQASDRSVNVWLIGDGEECVVVDPPAGSAERVLEAVGERWLTAVLCTHAVAGEGSAAPDLLEARPRTRIGLHSADLDAWTVLHPDVEPNLVLADGDTITTGDIELVVLHTPGHSPGSCCFHAADLGVIVPGPTDVTQVERLAELDPETQVLPRMGEPTRLGDLRRDLPSDSAGSAHST